MIQLYPDQDQFIANIRSALAQSSRVLAYAPTGFGKTTCFSYMTGRAVERGHVVGLGVHREELVQQVSDTLKAFGVKHGLIAAGATYLPGQRAYVVSVPTYVRRLKHAPKFSLIIQDEGHHAILGNQWGKFIEHSPDAKIIGFSGSPIRLDGRGMREMFDTLVLGPSVKELIAVGRLSRYKAFLPPPVGDRSKLHIRYGEVKRSEAEAEFDKPVIYGDAIAHYQRIADWKRAVIFTVSVAAAHHAAEQFNSAGYKAVAIDGTLDKLTRRNIVRDFNDGKLSHLSSCSIVDEGFDCPGIEVGIDLCPTESLQRAIQRWGRTLRVANGKKFAYLIDHVGNMGTVVDGILEPKHGMPDDDREWTLDGVKDRPKSEKPPPVPTCPRCFSCNIIGNTCQDCGAKTKSAEDAIRARQVEQVDGELTEVNTEEVRRVSPILAAQSKARDLDALLRLGHSESRAKHILAARAEKDQLRETLRSLGPPMTMHDIRQLKPKQLREWIDKLTPKEAAHENV